MIIVNIVQICAPTQIFSHERHLTWEEVEKFKSEYAIIDNIGNIYEVKSKDIFKEYENIDHKVLAGTLQDVNIDSFCDKYNLDNICSEPRSNHILVSKGLDARVVDGPMMKSVEIQPMVVDVTYKKVRSDYEKFKNI